VAPNLAKFLKDFKFLNIKLYKVLVKLLQAILTKGVELECKTCNFQAQD
jgi:hypothetical protein